MSLYLAIDFGSSTNYVMSLNDENNKLEEVLLGGFGKDALVNNIIYYENKDNFSIGEIAQKKTIVDPRNTVKDVKKKICYKDYKEYIPSLNKDVSASYIVRDILKKIKDTTEQNNGGSICKSVLVTIPFTFLHNERAIIKDAVRKANMKFLGFIEEPIAAAINYFNEFSEEIKENENILIFDMGGGTLDLTICKFKCDDGKKTINILNTDGERDLGGNLITEIILNYINSKYNLNMANYSNELEKINDLVNLRNQIEDMKYDFSSEEDSSEIEAKLNCGIIIKEELEEEVFNEILEDNNFYGRIEDALDNVIYDIDLEYEDIDEVILVGGVTKIGVLRKFIERLFSNVKSFEEPEKAVGQGAGEYLKAIRDRNTKRFEIISKLNKPVGINLDGKFKEILPKNSDYSINSKIKWSKIDEESISPYLDVYQGDNENIDECINIGRIYFDNRNEDDEIGLSLSINNDGTIDYRLYKKGRKNEIIQFKSGVL